MRIDEKRRPDLPGFKNLLVLKSEILNVQSITVFHVRGKVNAGGVGFVVANDIVLVDQTVQFSLSE
jgi:hypothetical protein